MLTQLVTIRVTVLPGTAELIAAGIAQGHSRWGSGGPTPVGRRAPSRFETRPPAQPPVETGTRRDIVG
ncbi:MAG: hypothetical protein J2P19_05870 [Pseudonocardia sp.]|nr:hypothetical protein [Pseudonocardia sp.]